MARCLSCGADWGASAHTEDCKECGGGPMERNCIVCGDRCGAVFKRAVLDSNDSGVAHWIGRCNLPMEEQIPLIREQMERHPPPPPPA